MELKEVLRKLDETILFADFQSALDTFFSKKIRTIHKDYQVKGLEAKRAYLEKFFKEVSAVKEITLHKQYSQKPETFSLFTFSFEMHSGNEISWFEVIRRKWKKGKVVEEEFWINPGRQVLDLLEKNASEEIARKDRKKAGNRKKTKETSDLTAIKGIGPKSAAFFNKEGVKSLEQLAALPLSKLKTLLKKLNWKSPYLQPEYLKKESKKLSGL